MALRRDLLDPKEATNDGSRLLRLLLKEHTAGAIARRMRCDERTIRMWAREESKPGLVLRARGRKVLDIDETAWDEPPDTYVAGDPKTDRKPSS